MIKPSDSHRGGEAATSPRNSTKIIGVNIAKGLVMGLGLGASLVWAQCPGGGPAPSTLATEDFENADATCWASTNSGCGQFTGITSGLSIATSPARLTKSLKIVHTANETYQHADFAIRPTDTLIFRAYYYFPTGYDFAQGQKVARFWAKTDSLTYQDLYLQIVSAGGPTGQCGTTDAGSIGIYSTSGPAFSSVTGTVTLARNTWHAIKVQLIYNTSGSSNGSATVWVDGTQIAQSTGLDLRGTIPSSIKWSDVEIGGGYSNGAGNNPCPDPNTNATYYVDDIEVGTNNDVINPPPSPSPNLVFNSTLETEDPTCWNSVSGWRSGCGSFRSIAPVMTLNTNSADAHGGSKSLKVYHTGDETYGYAILNFPPTDTLWYSAYYKFASGFDYGMGMKIARFLSYDSTAKANEYVLQIQSAGTASQQCGVTAAGQIGIYHNCTPGSSGCATGTDFSPVTYSASNITLTNWNNFKVRIINNKVGQSDGSLTLYVNGTQVAQTAGITVRGSIPATVKWNQLYTGGWYSNSAGGANSCPAPSGTSTYYFIDDIKIAYSDPG